MADTKDKGYYVQMADQLAFEVDPMDVTKTQTAMHCDDLKLAKAQVYATLALRDTLDDVHTMLDTIAAKLDALAGPPGW